MGQIVAGQSAKPRGKEMKRRRQRKTDEEKKREKGKGIEDNAHHKAIMMSFVSEKVRKCPAFSLLSDPIIEQ